MNRRKPLDGDDRFKGLPNAEQAFMQGSQPVDPSQTPVNKPKSEHTPKASKSTTKSDPWSGLKPPEKEPTVRLNVDIPISLNDKLADKARQLRQPKTELVRKLLDWALDESIE